MAHLRPPNCALPRATVQILSAVASGPGPAEALLTLEGAQNGKAKDQEGDAGDAAALGGLRDAEPASQPAAGTPPRREADRVAARTGVDAWPQGVSVVPP